MTRPGIGFPSAEGRGADALRVELGFLTNVGLDTKTIRRVEQGNAINDGAAFHRLAVGPRSTSRASFSRWTVAPPRSVSAEAYASHMESIEWLGKIRSFLRSHGGWVPEDEREDDVD